MYNLFGGLLLVLFYFLMNGFLSVLLHLIDVLVFVLLVVLLVLVCRCSYFEVNMFDGTQKVAISNP